MITIDSLRQFRVGQFTVFDTLAAYLGILILSPILTWLGSRLHLRIPVISWLWFTMPLSVLFHIIFQQPTPLIKILSNPGQLQFYIAVLTLAAMTYMGFRKISKSS